MPFTEDLEKMISIYFTLYSFQKEKLLSDLENYHGREQRFPDLLYQGLSEVIRMFCLFCRVYKMVHKIRSIMSTMQIFT